jgi:Zn finger protein HypA/HybF involved in hydrogenase expression
MAKRSIIWKIDKEQLCEIVKSKNTITDILKHFGILNRGGNFKTLKRRLQSEDIDFSHITLGIGNRKGKNQSNKKIPLSDILVENSSYDKNHLKHRLIDEGILENKCKECGLEKEWNNKKISLQIDHINGNVKDHRIENLRIICPNCHSQTENFAGKKLRKERNCIVCGKHISWESKFNLCTKHNKKQNHLIGSIYKKGVCKDCGQPCSQYSKNSRCFKCYTITRRK